VNEELNKLLIDALKKTGGAIEKSVDFAIQQAPDLINQAMLWNMTISILRCIAALAIMTGAYILHRFVIKLAEETSDDEFWFILMFSWPIASIITVFVFSLEWLKILIAPKVWLIEYAVSLAK
jgi:hypothetical protein